MKREVTVTSSHGEAHRYEANKRNTRDVTVSNAEAAGAYFEMHRFTKVCAAHNAA